MIIKNASYEAKLDIPFIPDYCKYSIIFNPLNIFYFAHFSLLTLVPINVKKFNEESYSEGRFVTRRPLLH